MLKTSSILTAAASDYQTAEYPEKYTATSGAYSAIIGTAKDSMLLALKALQKNDLNGATFHLESGLKEISHATDRTEMMYGLNKPWDTDYPEKTN